MQTTKYLMSVNAVEPFNPKQLYEKVIKKFDDYNDKKFYIKYIAESSATRKNEIHEEQHQKGRSDPTFKALLDSEKLSNYVENFERKIEFLKTQFTLDEMEIFNASIIERRLDKDIRDDLAKSDRKYDCIKKSCYIKVALCLNLIKLRSVEDSKLQMVAHVYE